MRVNLTLTRYKKVIFIRNTEFLEFSIKCFYSFFSNIIIYESHDY